MVLCSGRLSSSKTAKRLYKISSNWRAWFFYKVKLILAINYPSISLLAKNLCILKNFSHFLFSKNTYITKFQLEHFF